MARSSNNVAGQISMGSSGPTVRESAEFLATCILSLGVEAQAGQVVEVRAEPDNPADPNALAVYAGEERIGYLANKQTTLRAGTRSAASLQKLVASDKTAKTMALLSKPETITSSGKELTSFQASLFFVPKRESSDKPKVLSFATFGGAASAPGRAGLLQRLKNGPEKEAPVVVTQGHASQLISVYLQSDPHGDCVSQVSSSEDNKAQRDQLSAAIAARRSGVPGVLKLNQDGKNMDLEVQLEDDGKAVTEAIDRVITRCVEQANTLEAKVDFMKKAGLTGNMICQVLDGYTRYPEEFEAMIPVPECPFTEDKTTGEAILYRAIAYHLRGKHIRLVGEKGCGKNTLIETVDWLLHRPLFRLSGNSDLDKTDILGSRTLKDGSMTYELTTFLQVLEAGGDVDLDECNAIKPDVELIIHSLTDQTRAINVPGYGEVKMDPKATFWATMNEEYVGTTDMNDATVDRFVTLRLPVPPNIRGMLKARCPDASDSNIEYCQRVYADMQKGVQNGTLSSTCISVRGFIDALECSEYLPVHRSLLDTLAAKPQDVSERNAIMNILANLGEA